MPDVLDDSLSKQPPDLRLRAPGFSAAENEIVRRLVGHTIAEVEQVLICETLAHHRGNRTRAASVLDISIRALRNKIRAYKAFGMTVPDRSSCRSPNCGFEARGGLLPQQQIIERDEAAAIVG